MQGEDARAELFGGRFRSLAVLLAQLREQLGDGIGIDVLIKIGTSLATIANRAQLDKSGLSRTIHLLQLVGQFLAVEGGYADAAATKRRITLAGDLLLAAASLTPNEVDDRVASAVAAFLSDDRFAEIVAQIVAERFALLPDGVLPMYGAQPIELMGECLGAAERSEFNGELLKLFLPLLWELLGELFGLLRIEGPPAPTATEGDHAETQSRGEETEGADATEEVVG